MSTFGNFGSGNPSQNLFGGGNKQDSTSTAAPPSLFGATKPSTTNMFGTGPSAGTGNSASPFGNMFGATSNAANPAPATNPPTGGLFGGATTSTTPAAGGGLFGAAKPSTSTTPAGGSLFGAGTNTGGAAGTPTSTPSLFGTAPSSTQPSLFGAATPSTQKPNPLFGGTGTASTAAASTSAPNASASTGTGLPNFSAQPAATKPTPSLFSNPASTTPATGPPTVAGSSSDSAAKPAEKPATPSAAPFGSNLFAKPGAPASATAATPGFSLGGTTATKSTTGISGGLFGTTPAAKPEEKKDTATATSTPNLFGAPAANKESTEKKETPAAPTGINLGVTVTKEAEKSSGAAATTNSSGATIAVPPPSMLRGKTIEEIVNRWSTDLETHVREFSKYAGEIAVWDRTLIENSNNLAALYSHVLAAEQEQNDIERSLDLIEQQQRDLAATLDVYEKSAQEILGGQAGALRLESGPADTERDKNYVLATELHTHLDDLTGSLAQMIESVNGMSLSSEPNNNTENPMSQIAQILSNHLESLQWIDNTVQEIDGKVTEVEKRIQESGEGGRLDSNPRSSTRGFGPGR